MRSAPVLLSIWSVSLGLTAGGPGALAGPWHARGDFYCPGGDCWAADAGNELFDDGLHGDGEAGDGVFAGEVVSDQAGGRYDFKIATADWSASWPTRPQTPLSNAILYTSGPGDVVRFRLDANAAADGWQPAENAVATDHFAPAGTALEVIGSAAETGGWSTGKPAVFAGGTWERDLMIVSPGAYEFKFRAAGTWDVCNLGVHYNMFVGDNFTYATTQPNVAVRFEFDPATGRARAVELGPSAVAASGWGGVKALFR